MAPLAPLNISPSLVKICPRSPMSKLAPPMPKPNGSDPGPGPELPEPDPESGSFLSLSRSGSFPAEKPKGRSAIPTTVLMTRCPGVPVGHAVCEHGGSGFTVGGVNRRILTLLVALVPIVAFGVLLSVVTVPFVSLGPGPTFNTLGEVEGKQVVDIKSTEGPADLVHPTAGHLNMT